MMGVVLAFKSQAWAVVSVKSQMIGAPSAASTPALPETNTMPDQDDSDLVDKPATDTAIFDFGATSRADREALLKVLKSEIEAHLSKADSDRLKRNVMRLGSYRADWAKEARDFLLANAPVAELYLYQFSMMKNSRLNGLIRDTLLEFKSLRYPKAALAFLSFFVLDRERLDESLRLVEKAVAQDSSLAAEALALFGGSLGDSMSLVQRLSLAETVCRRGRIPESATDIVRSWQTQAQSFWEKAISLELEGCLPR